MDLVWIDLELTGLDIKKDVVIEISVILTDPSLEQIIHGPTLVIHQSQQVMDSMNEWCLINHKKSGLTQRVLESTITMEGAERQIMEFLQQHLEPKRGILAGSSVHVDRQYLEKCMPRITDFLHYRCIIDVSTIKELCRRWKPQVFKSAPVKKNVHRSLDDILESIQELRHYKQHLFLYFACLWSRLEIKSYMETESGWNGTKTM
ncbi:oligoribonuclease [Gorgonomyces haynaldii]|nr:oligoribonuclease [Gorgonomyces haynaldii]